VTYQQRACHTYDGEAIGSHFCSRQEKETVGVVSGKDIVKKILSLLPDQDSTLLAESRNVPRILIEFCF
jgi:hypothetical protein